MWLVKSELYWQSCIRKISHHLFTLILHLALDCATVQPSDDLTQNIKELWGEVTRLYSLSKVLLFF